MEEEKNTLNEGPEVVLIDTLIGDPDGVIERQEARGQAALVNSDLLPTDRRGDDSVWEALGFVFGEVVADDPMFQHATLPEGWARKGSGHAMWSYLYDADGFRRVAIFYKAAFYDRSANMHIERTPLTDAQSDAISALYDSLESTYDRDKPFWGDMDQQVAADDRSILVTWKLRQVHPYPEPETVYAIRAVVVMADGSIASDVTEQLVGEDS